MGVLWSILNPLLTMLVLSLVFSTIYSAQENFQLYILSGLLMFNYFSESTGSATTSIVRNFHIITKVSLPKYIFPVSSACSALIPLTFSIATFFILGAFLGLRFWWGDILALYPIVCLFIFAIGLSLLLSSWDVIFRDVQHLYSVVLMIWMYATPILYDIGIIPEAYRVVFVLNPLYRFIAFFRSITLSNALPAAGDFLFCAIWAIASLALGSVVFARRQRNFIFYT